MNNDPVQEPHEQHQDFDVSTNDQWFLYGKEAGSKWYMLYACVTGTL